jgi:uncharacterized protein (TIGR02265 family)
MSVVVPPGFAPPDLAAPLDVDAAKAALAPGAAIKGMFAQALCDELKKKGFTPAVRASWVGFKDYPLPEYFDFLVDAAGKIHPNTPVRAALRTMGRSAYATMASSLAGRVVFGVLGRDIQAITRIVSKAYELAGRGSRATLLGASASHSHVRLEDVAFADCYQVGCFEGVLDACGQQGEVRVKLLSATSAELFTTWGPKGP